MPSQYEATPKQIFYHSMMALCDVQPGGGAIMILPECYRRVKEMIRSMPPQEVGDTWSPECAPPSAARRCVRLLSTGGVACNGRHGAYSIGRGVEQRLRPMLDLGSGMEVLLEEGDLFVVDPMSASLPPPLPRARTRFQLAGSAEPARVGCAVLHAATPNTRGDLPGYSRCTAWARPRLRTRPH